MKVSKSLIQAIAVAVTVATTVSACTKEQPVSPNGVQVNPDGCLACGRG